MHKYIATLTANEVNKFVITETLDTYPKTYIVMGEVNTSAEKLIKTEDTIGAKKGFLSIFWVIYSLAGKATTKIAKVERTESKNATFLMANGSKSNIRLTAAPRVFSGVFSLPIIKAKAIIIYVIPARIIDIVKPHTAITESVTNKISKALK
jgi:hypothetical protein